MESNFGKQPDVSRPETVLLLSWKKPNPIQRFDMSVPPPVPEKDTPPTFQRPMTGASNSLSFTTVSLVQKRKLKYDEGKYASVELVPQPSDDADDPLVWLPRICGKQCGTDPIRQNWPRWRKELNLVSLLVMVGLVGGMKTAFITTNELMADQFSVSYTMVAALTAVPLMLAAVSGMASSIIARMLGKRPVYLTSFVLIFVGTVWNMTTRTSFGQCMAARVFQGLGWGAFDTLVPGSIRDTYYVRLGSRISSHV